MTYTHERFEYLDAYGINIHAQRLLPATPAKAVVQILHGIGEHSDRYLPFAKALVEAGYMVYAEDHRGHGRTGLEQHKDPNLLGKLGPGGLRATEAAISELTSQIRQNHPQLKVAGFGHSWGSLMLQRLLNQNPSLFDAVILSGSAYRTFWHLNSGNLNKRYGEKNGPQWLTRDAKIWEEVMMDPMFATVNILRDFGLADSLRLFGVPKKVDPQVAMLLVSGSQDALNLHGGLEKLAAAYRKKGAKDVELKMYSGARHEILNELNHEEVYEDLIAWLDTHVLDL